MCAEGHLTVITMIANKTWGTLYYSGLALIPAWINNQVSSKVCNEIPILKLQRVNHFNVGMDM